MSAFDYTSGNPNNLVGGTAASMADIQGPFTDLKTFLNARLAAVPTLVSSLPVSPVDGQEIYFLADASNGVVWHLRYRSASGSLYKWEFLGGGALNSSVTSAASTASTTYIAIDGPAVTVPLAGDYDVQLVVSAANSVGGGALAAIKVGAAAAADANAAIMGSANEFGVTVARRVTMTVAAAIDTWYRAGSGTASFPRRNMRVWPVRVG